MNKLTYKQYLGIAVVVVAVAILGFLWQKPWQAGASIEEGQEYFATSTRNFDGTALANLTRLKDAGNNCAAGSLARITISGAPGPSVIRFWDATTTNSTLRAAAYASSTIFLTEINALTATSTTLDLDLRYTCGLIYQLVSGSAPTSTVMWR